MLRVARSGALEHRSPNHFHWTNAWQMVRRRAKAAAGLTTEVCNHTFRGTGITASPAADQACALPHPCPFLRWPYVHHRVL
jgi:hypothetical protein